MHELVDIYSEGFAVLPGNSAMVTGGYTKDDGAKHKGVKPKDVSAGNPWSEWGDDNLFPQNVLEDIESASLPGPALQARRNVHYARGIRVHKEVAVEGSEETSFQTVKDSAVKLFFRKNELNRQYIDLIGDLETFANGWIECITNVIGTRINKVRVLDPAYCRLERINERSMRIQNLYYSAQWPNPDKENYLKIPMYDPNKWEVDAMGRNCYPDSKFVYPLSYRSRGKSYYHLAVWNGLRNSGWIKLLQQIPASKLAMLQNQVTIKYHVEIPDNYFVKRFPAPQYDDTAREKKRQEKMAELKSFLTSVENSGKSIATFSYYDEVTKSEFPGWKFHVIDNKLKDGMYLPDSQAGNGEVLLAMGVDPAIMGASIVPGAKMGAGSGSDKKEALWAMNAQMGPSRTESLHLLYFIKDFNEWPEDVEFDYVVPDTSRNDSQNPTKIEKRVDATA